MDEPRQPDVADAGERRVGLYVLAAIVALAAGVAALIVAIVLVKGAL